MGGQLAHHADATMPTTRPAKAPPSAPTSHSTRPAERPGAARRMLGEMLNAVRQFLEEMQLLEPVEQDPAADPQHRRGADRRQAGQQFRDDMDQPVAEARRPSRLPSAR